MAATKDPTPSELIDGRIEELGDWRGEMLARIRRLVHDAIPDVVEEWKWRGVPTWYANGGIVCTGETYKDKVKVTFHKGAKLDDPNQVFNSGLDGNARRVIDLLEGDDLDDVGDRLVDEAAKQRPGRAVIFSNTVVMALKVPLRGRISPAHLFEKGL